MGQDAVPAEIKWRSGLFDNSIQFMKQNRSSFIFTTSRGSKHHKVQLINPVDGRTYEHLSLHLGEDSAVTFAALWKFHQSCELGFLSATVLDTSLSLFISIVLIGSLYTLYGYSIMSLIIITSRKISILLWLIWVISALLFAAQAVASSAWLLTFPATSLHPVPRRGDTEFLCPAELSGSATKSSFTTKTRRHSLPAKNETRFKVLSGTHVRWDDVQDHGKTATTSYWHLNQCLLEMADLQEP